MASIRKTQTSRQPTYNIKTDSLGGLNPTKIIQGMDNLGRRISLASVDQKSGNKHFDLTVKLDSNGMPLAERKELLEGVLKFLARNGAITRTSFRKLLDSVTE